MASVEIVSAFDGLAAYKRAAAGASTARRHRLYRRHVLDPVWQWCIAGSALEDRAAALLDASSAAIAQLPDADAVDRPDLRRAIEATFLRCAALLPGPDTAVGLFPLDPANELVVERMHGVLGWTAGAGRIALLVMPSGDWLDWIPYTVAHEYHHSAWRWRHPDQGDFSLLEYLIFEGRADSFATLAVPGVIAPWTDALTAADELEQWRAMQPYLHQTDRSVTWPFLGGNESIPRWTGYTIGYHIVQAYLLAHPETSIEGWSALEPEELLHGSGYG